MSDGSRPPDGCPGCNPDQVMPFIHSRGLHVEELPKETASSPDTVTCERCGRVWILMPKDNAHKPVA